MGNKRDTTNVIPGMKGKVHKGGSATAPSSPSLKKVFGPAPGLSNAEQAELEFLNRFLSEAALLGFNTDRCYSGKYVGAFTHDVTARAHKLCLKMTEVRQPPKEKSSAIDMHTIHTLANALKKVDPELAKLVAKRVQEVLEGYNPAEALLAMLMQE